MANTLSRVAQSNEGDASGKSLQLGSSREGDMLEDRVNIDSVPVGSELRYDGYSTGRPRPG
eukprot:scaffold55062_cov30-Tisochrysis_lutea.AAC.3